jgi:hypothetical protein
MAFFQAFADDSGSALGDRRLFMAGYVGYVTDWERFSDVWQDALNAPPSIEYLEMNEAVGLRGQFKNWSESDRDLKLKRFAAIIRQSGLVSFHCSLDRERFNALIPLTPRGFNPYFCCCVATFSTVAKFMARNGGLPIEFIFDRQDGVSADIPFFFDEIRKFMEPDVKAALANPPSFKASKGLPPLQAADMLASELRRQFERDSFGIEHLEVPSVINTKLHAYAELPEKMLEGWGQQFATFPGIDRMQTKREWRRVKGDAARAIAAGYIPPYGTRWRNWWVPLAIRAAKFFRR